MHTEMWQHPATQRNVAVLRDAASTCSVPPRGADGRRRGPWPPRRARGGAGAPRHPARLESRQGSPDLAGTTVVVTAGGTREPIDPVRFLGNRSTGKMGFAVAAAAAGGGRRSTSSRRPTSPADPAGVTRHDVTTASRCARRCSARRPCRRRRQGGGRGRLPAREHRDLQAQEGRRRPRSIELVAQPRHPRRARRPPRGRATGPCSSGSRPRPTTSRPTAAPSSSASRPTCSSSTTSAPTTPASRSTPTGSSSSTATAPGRGGPRVQGRGRRPHPRRGGRPARLGSDPTPSTVRRTLGSRRRPTTRRSAAARLPARPLDARPRITGAP
jgi:hypothetical protein